MFLQSYVVAVCTFERVGGIAEIRSLHGTAFFIGKSGLFLTARHVLEQAAECGRKNSWEVGLCVKGDNGRSKGEEVAVFTSFEYAPAPYDVALGTACYKPDSPLSLGLTEVSIWQEIAAIGYPTSASAKVGDALWMNLRGQRGYVQRTTLPRDMPIGDHPAGIELSFLIGPGMSGSPIFNTQNETVIGVGVGAYRSEQIEDSIEEIDSNGGKYKELRLRIEQHGFAHALNGLLDWYPSMLDGKSLLEASKAE
ncbi:MAG: serine protease [Novosphingobium sp.]